MRSANFLALVLLLNVVLPRLASTSPPDKLSHAGESCSRSADCEGELRCVGQICVDSGPGDLTDRAKAQVHDVARAVTSYVAAHGKLPLNLQVLAMKGFIGASRLRDPWDHALTFGPGTGESPLAFRLCSRGPDARRSTADDICSRRDGE